MTRSTGEWKLPELIDLKEDNEWVAIPRIARTTPFGYKADPENEHILRPVPRELDALAKAKEHLKPHLIPSYSRKQWHLFHFKQTKWT